jgi:hypothetical protein
MTASLTFQNVWKAGKQIVKQFENLVDVRFIEFKSAVKHSLVVFVQFEIKAVEVWNA